MNWIILVGLLFCKTLFANDMLGLPALPIPADNPQTDAKIALGRLLFNDPRFSADGSISCASCHAENKAYTDGLPVAQGIKHQTGTRNAPTVINAAYFSSLFHDGRAASLEQQALGPLTNPIEHGLKNHQFVVDIVQRDNSYVSQFQSVFDISKEQIGIEHIVKAIASFERTLLSGNSPFDQYYFAGKKTLLSASAARGVRIFRRKGNCANCHEISWNNALFTDNRFYNIGVGFKALAPLLDDLVNAMQGGQSIDFLKLTTLQKSALGRFNVTRKVSDIGKFKTPGLRNISLTAPYMHDGSVKTLEEVIEYYDKGGEKNRFLDAAIFPLKLTHQEKKDLVAFLLTLNSPLAH